MAHGPDQAAVASFGAGILQVDDGPDGGGQPADEGDLQDEADDEVEDPTPEEEGQPGKEDGEEEHGVCVCTNLRFCG